MGRMQALGFDLRREAVAETLTQEVHKTSDIEGEKLDLHQVRSSVGRRLGIEVGGLSHVEERVEGVVEMMLDATGNYDLPLTRERLWGWQAALFPTGRSRLRRIIVGAWRDDSTGPMQVILGPIGVPPWNTVGENRAIVFGQGRFAEGRWRRESAGDWFRITGPGGDPIRVPPGRLWIMIYPETSGLVW